MISSLLFFLSTAWGASVPVLKISDTINPGTADYILSGITHAEETKSPYLVLELDTPGGLLNSTRQIVQAMLNTKVPIVVYISPKGAQAGSAGALITFAADIAAMAPGTNIGAAHPVSGGGEKMDKTMSDKITNDTAAFAESLAKTKGRNQEWAIKAVRESASIIAEEALKEGVIDLMAEDLSSLLTNLSGYRLKVPKANLAELPKEVATPSEVKMSIKQEVVSFLANPNLAYLIMTLGGLCIWIELSHPGMIVPGVIGSLCILISLISFQLMPIHFGALALIFLGIGLLIAEMYVPSFGILGVGGIAAFLIGSLFLMDTNVPEFQISLSLILPTAAVLAGFGLILGYLVAKTLRTKKSMGLSAMVGIRVEVRSPFSHTSPGKVLAQGELWNAITEEKCEFAIGAHAVVKEVRGMILVVSPVS